MPPIFPNLSSHIILSYLAPYFKGFLLPSSASQRKTVYMAKKDHTLEDDYIDMDINPTTTLCYGKSSPPHAKEFEFQMSFNQLDKETTTSPADELFYKGKLLPLHLPPRLEMVQKLLGEASCSISEKLMDECSAEVLKSQAGKFWPRKLKLVRHSSLSLKLRASKAYLKSLFTTKSECSEKNNPFWKYSKPKSLKGSIEEECIIRRKSFSGAINSSCSSSSSSSFSSVRTNGLCGSQMLTRSSSLNSERESSILGAIAYCKKTQASASDAEFGSLSALGIVAERPGLCRG